MGMIETFEHEGARWRRVRAEAKEAFIVAADLGQSTDPTAICVLHHTITPLETWTVVKHPNGGGSTKQDVCERFDVRHIERVPLGTSYVDITAIVAAIKNRPPLRYDADLLIDETGVGRAVGDIFDDAGLKPIRVTITAGANDATQESSRRWHVPKMVLISALDARLHTGELRFAAELQEAGTMAEELKDFRRKVSAAGRHQYEARVGRHDDLVLSVALAVWWASRPRFEAGWAPLIGLY